MAEETTEETTEAATEAATVEPQRVASKTTYTCSHCGTTVVPVEVETPTGTRHKCPKCHKFMKLETPEQVKERLEESKGPLPPPEVRVVERVKELLVVELPKVYGIPKTDKARTITAILDTLTPAQAVDEWKLHGHVKKFARNANDEHLESVIVKIFSDLEQDGYLPKDVEGYRPRYDRRRRVSREPRYGSRVSGRRGDYEDYEEDYGDYPPRRRRTRMKVVVDGQEIETDYEGYMAHQTWKREQAEEKRKDQLFQLEVKKLGAEILKITGETAGSKTPQGSFEEVREFIDEKGNFCDPKKAVSVRIKTIPMGTKALTLEDVRKVVREGKEELTAEKVRDIIRETGKGELSEETIRSIIKEETTKEPLTAEGVEAIVRRVTTDEKEKLTPEKIREIVKQEVRTPLPGTMTAEGVLATAVQEAGRREPVKIIIEGAERILAAGPAGTKPPSGMAGEGERGGVIKELRKHGLVTVIRERGR